MQLLISTAIALKLKRKSVSSERLIPATERFAAKVSRYQNRLPLDDVWWKLVSSADNGARALFDGAFERADSNLPSFSTVLSGKSLIRDRFR